MKFIEAIAWHEGFYVKGSRAQRNNNPGNIEWGPFARAHGATSIEIPHGKEKPRFAYFPVGCGFSAMSALLCGEYLGLTIGEAITKWAPPSENDTAEYINDVCAKTGLPSTTVLTAALINMQPDSEGLSHGNDTE
jgi:hypothetical protein